MSTDNISDFVVYAVYHPTKGWVTSSKYYDSSFGSKPMFWRRHTRARDVAKKLKAQLVTFDVTARLRSWPSEE